MLEETKSDSTSMCFVLMSACSVHLFFVLVSRVAISTRETKRHVRYGQRRPRKDFSPIFGSPKDFQNCFITRQAHTNEVLSNGSKFGCAVGRTKAAVMSREFRTVLSPPTPYQLSRSTRCPRIQKNHLTPKA